MATGTVVEQQASHLHHHQFNSFANMEHPPSPMGAPPNNMSSSHMAPPPAQPEPTSPPDHRGPPPPAYRHHPGYGGPPPPSHGYPGYPQYGGYGGPPHSPYGGSGPPPSHHHQQYPPSYGYGYPPSRGPPPPYYGNYEGYPPGPPQRKHPLAQAYPPFRGSPNKSSPSKSSPSRSPPSDQPKIVDPAEVERLRAAAATEVTAVEVKPIRSDFHFFMMENKAKYRAEAEEEVRKTAGESADGKLDLLLVNTNLNTRMMKAWEDLSQDKRDLYMQKEEDDRRRFMEEDEIASRHCATLTARGKSPKSAENKKSEKEGREESETKPVATPPRDAPHLRKEGSVDDADTASPKTKELKTEDAEMFALGSSQKKRLSPPDHPTQESSESPAKKNKV